jgi:hypothetical protein
LLLRKASLQSCSSNRRSKIRTLKKRFPILLPQLREQDLHIEKSASHLGGALSNLASHLGEATFIKPII